MSDEKNIAMIEDQAERYYEKYRDQMDMLEDTPLAQVNGGLNKYDAWALGKQLEQYDMMEAMIKEDAGNTNQLGKLPVIAHDVITAVHGVSILPMVASVQPIEDEKGIVFFKQVRSGDTRGSQTDGDVTVDPRQGTVTPSGYSSNVLSSETLVTTVGATLSYSATVAAPPLRSETLKLFLDSAPAVEAEDTGPAEGGDPNIGILKGVGLSGTVDYTTGQVDIDFAADPLGGNNVIIEYQQNFEKAADIPTIDTFFDSKTIQARVYALKGCMGMLQSFAMKRRFGMQLQEELAKDLVQEINREIGGDMIRKTRAAAVGSTTFSRTLPGGVSEFEHRQAYMFALNDAEAELNGNAGRGTISTLILGRTHAAYISGLPGFTKLYDGASLGAHLYGTLNGITVIRVLEDAVLGAEQGIAMWKGPTPFEAACVWSPFMPLTVTGVIPEAPNPLNNQRAAAVWAGVDTLVAQYATNFDLIP